MDDWRLLRQYVEQDSQEAFATLSQRYVDLVYSVCRRELGDPDMAQDVTQAVFLILARKAFTLRRGVVLSGWLFQTARFAAKNAKTRERRRRHYEQEAAQAMTNEQTTQENALWNSLEPFLNSALARLGTADRDAVLVRYMEDRSLAETGAALGVSEDAARKRIARALEKLRRLLGKEGLIVSGAALAALLSTRAVQAAPAHCALGAASQINAGLIGSHSYQIAEGVLHAMKVIKLKMLAGAVALTLAGTAVTYTVVRAATLRPHTPPRSVVLAEEPPVTAGQTDALTPTQDQAAPLTPAQVVQRSEQAYAALKSYQGKTTVTTTGTVNGAANEYHTSADIQFVRPNKIRVEGTDTSGNPFAYVSTDKATYLKAVGSRWDKVENSEMALGSVTGITMSAGTTIPATLLHTHWGYPFPAASALGPTMTQEDVDGHACYHLTATVVTIKDSFWIDQKTFLLLRLVEDSSDTVPGKSISLHEDQRFTNEKLDVALPDSIFATPTGQ